MAKTDAVREGLIRWSFGLFGEGAVDWYDGLVAAVEERLEAGSTYVHRLIDENNEDTRRERCL